MNTSNKPQISAVSGIVRVVITADQRVKLSRTVEMTREDFDAYQELVEDTDMSIRELDSRIQKIAERYGFGVGDDQYDWDDPEEITFETEASREQA